jgi:hypothetical protein
MPTNNVQNWRQRTKRKLVDCCGGSCNKCGYNKCIDALDFHHIDKSTKSFTISQAMASPRAWNLLTTEIKKCVLLCCICHRELHAGLWDISDIKVICNVTSKTFKKDVPTGLCPVCGVTTYRDAINCSYVCSGKSSRKVDWDSIDLLELLKSHNHNKSQVARILGISYSSVTKRLKVISKTRPITPLFYQI